MNVTQGPILGSPFKAAVCSVCGEYVHVCVGCVCSVCGMWCVYRVYLVYGMCVHSVYMWGMCLHGMRMCVCVYVVCVCGVVRVPP